MQGVLLFFLRVAEEFCDTEKQGLSLQVALLTFHKYFCIRFDKCGLYEI